MNDHINMEGIPDINKIFDTITKIIEDREHVEIKIIEIKKKREDDSEKDL